MSRVPTPESLAAHVVVAGGAATAGSRLTAFDAALRDAGLHEANLLSVSSIVPGKATVHEDMDPERLAETIEPGAFVPAVYAFQASDDPADQVHAAVAGGRLGIGHGVIVEQHGTNETEDVVRNRCEAMLREMAALRQTTLDGRPWFRYESTSVPAGDDWAGAIAAVPYLDSLPE